MVRNSQSWDLGEPDLNDRSQPVVHNIAQKLGCIRPNSDIDLPVHSVFREDEAGMGELARQLEEQQSHEHDDVKDSSSELDHSGLEQDYRKMAFGNQNTLSLSPQSFASGSDFEFSTTPVDADPSAMFTSQSSSLPNFGTTSWPMHNKTQANPMGMQFTQQPSSLQNLAMLNQGMLDNDYGTIKPDYLSRHNPDVMMGMNDPMIYAGYDNDAMRL